MKFLRLQMHFFLKQLIYLPSYIITDSVYTTLLYTTNKKDSTKVNIIILELFLFGHVSHYFSYSWAMWSSGSRRGILIGPKVGIVFGKCQRRVWIGYK